jgi:hypothetical protein
VESCFETPAPGDNFPEQITDALKPARGQGFFPAFPFGSDLTEEEQRLIPARMDREHIQFEMAAGARGALRPSGI